MAASDSDQENPYASPKSPLDGPQEDSVDEDQDLFVVRPWFPPRDAIDFVLAFLAVGLLFGLVVGTVWALVYWWFGIKLAGFLIGLGVAGLGWSPAIFWLVSQLTIDPDGIALRRPLGKPKFLAWQDIRLIRPATRREVFLYGWLWPWPSREPTKTMSARGHYRIEWGNRFLYFPPRHPRQFVVAVRRFRPDLLRQTSASDKVTTSPASPSQHDG